MNNKYLLIPALALTIACLGTPSTPIVSAPGETNIIPTESLAPTAPVAVPADGLTSAPLQTLGLKLAFVKNGNVWMYNDSAGARARSAAATAGPAAAGRPRPSPGPGGPSR